MLSEISQRNTNNVWSHLHMGSKKTQKTNWNRNSRLVVAGGGGVGEMGEGRYKLPVLGLINSADVMYSMATTANNTLLYIWKLLRE